MLGRSPGFCGKAANEDRGMFEWIAGILALGLLVYLFLAMLKPEWFA